MDRGVTAGSAAETEICNIIVWPGLLPFCFVQNKGVVRQTIILPILHVVLVKILIKQNCEKCLTNE